VAPRSRRRIVIVGSILLASGIDAWWDERQDRAEEQRLLLSIHEDFTETQGLILEAVTFHRTYLSDALALRLDLITNEKLRSALAEWPRTLSEFTEQQIWTWDVVMESRPQLAASVPIADLILTSAGHPPPDLLYSPKLIAFLRSDVGRNYTALRAQAETFSVRDGELLLTAISELLRRIEEELD